MGCPINPRQSIAWYSKAAVQEEHQSELALSGWYLTGSEGVLQQSDTEAYLWARKAATAGLAKAEFAMGYFTEVGIGCPPSSEEAKRWYWRAACKHTRTQSLPLTMLTRNSAKLPQGPGTAGGAEKRGCEDEKGTRFTICDQARERMLSHVKPFQRRAIPPALWIVLFRRGAQDTRVEKRACVVV